MDIAEAKSLLGMVSGVLYVVGFIPYAKAIWRDRHISSGTEGKTEQELILLKKEKSLLTVAYNS